MKTMTAKFPSTCTRCWEAIFEGMEIEYDRESRTARHSRCAPQPRPEPSGDLKLALEYLQGLEGPSEFEAGLLEQYERKGQLTPKQIQSVMSALDAKDFPGPEVIPAGKYAMPIPEGINANRTHFFVKVWRAPANPKIVRTYILDGGEQHKANARKILRDLQEFGVEKAALLYGNRTGNCSICDQPLKNALSRKLGIGPVCSERFHAEPLMWSMRKDEARMWLRARGIDPKADLPLDFNLEAV